MHFAGLKARLDAAGMPTVIDHKLVRGLDYYGRPCSSGSPTSSVPRAHLRRWPLRRPGRAVGRQADPGVGFAMGIERLVLLLETLRAGAG